MSPGDTTLLEHSGSESDTEPVPEPERTTDGPELGFFGSTFAILFWLAIALAVAQGNKTSRHWLAHNWIWLSVLAAACLAIATLALSRGWLQKRSAPLRAAIFLLVGMPLIALGAASLFFWMPTQDQLITLRGVVLVVLVVTPALMWWLFLANQRASLLNEFLANLQRLGLLESTVAGEHRESDHARATRVSSYLQRFEATYGRLPAVIHRDVIADEFHPYSSEQARDQAPLATAAVPVSLAVIVLAIGWLIALPPINDFPADDITTPRWLLALSPNATPATFAFLGAYFFSMQMLFRRYVRADLRGSAYVAVVLRVLLAVIGAWVVSTVGKQAGWTEQSQLLTLSFVIGVFPMVTWQVIRGAASKVFKLALPSLESRLPLERLDGLTVWHETRLEEEDIENVQNMATADIVDLLVNTRIPATRIVDWVDQAILLTQLGPDAANNGDESSARRRLAKHGVRTASALLKTVADKTDEEMETFSRVLVDSDGNPAIPSIASAITTNSNLGRVLRWRGLEALAS
jgi:hypothetical protein